MKRCPFFFSKQCFLRKNVWCFENYVYCVAYNMIVRSSSPVVMNKR